MSLAETVGANIRRLRRERGLKQDELAQLIGASNSSVSNWETGRQCTLETIETIAEALHVSTNEITFTGKMPEMEIRSVEEGKRPVATLVKSPAYAGEPLSSRVEFSGELVGLPREILEGHPNSFFVRVRGLEAETCWESGALVLVDPDAALRLTQVVLASAGGGVARLCELRVATGGLWVASLDRQRSWFERYERSQLGDALVVEGVAVWDTSVSDRSY